LTSYRILLERTNLNGNEILVKSNELDSRELDNKLNDINDKWKNLMSLINELKEKYGSKSETTNKSNNQLQQQKNSTQNQQNKKMETTLNSFQLFSKKMNEHHEWQAKCEQLIERKIDQIDEIEIERALIELKEFQNDLPYRQTIFENDNKKFESKFETQKEIEMANTTSKDVLDNYVKVYKNFIYNKSIYFQN
jgi:hypothetical protein